MERELRFVKVTALAVSRTLNIERLNQGQPLIAAAPDSWDDAYTLNPTIVRLERSPKNDELIRGLLGPEALDDDRLHDGVVAIYYRGIPRDIPGHPPLRSAVGLAVFTPDLQLLKRFARPLVLPTDDPAGYDYSGVEDQRITRIGDVFYMVYCGFNADLPMDRKVSICLAISTDLINWEKLGPVRGNVNDFPNKDAVMIAEKINGSYMMLHRPMVGNQGDFTISIAISDSPTGEWNDVGPIMRAEQDPRYMISWLGAGSSPLPLGDNRFLADYHIGNFGAAGDRDYSAGYALLDFNKFRLESPQDIVEARCDNILEPETQYETNSPWPQANGLNCVFPAGSFEYKDDIILVYGGADAYVLGARINKQELLSYLESLNAPATDTDAVTP